jgi:hypothetical protein
VEGGVEGGVEGAPGSRTEVRRWGRSRREVHARVVAMAQTLLAATARVERSPGGLRPDPSAERTRRAASRAFKRHRTSVGVLPALLLASPSGCFLGDLVGTQVQGTLLRNGNPFRPTWCTSGEVSGFHGVEIENEAKERTRIVVDVDGSSRVVYFPPMSRKGIILTSCSEAELDPTSTRINGYRKWTGRARFNCSHEGVHLQGEVTFTCSAP